MAARVDAYCCNGNSRGHHNGAEQCVNALERLSLYRDSYYRQGSVACDCSREVSRHARCCDDNSETVCAGVLSELRNLLRGAVSGKHSHLEQYTELLESLGCLANNGEVAVAAHYYADFFF